MQDRSNEIENLEEDGEHGQSTQRFVSPHASWEHSENSVVAIVFVKAMVRRRGSDMIIEDALESLPISLLWVYDSAKGLVGFGTSNLSSFQCDATFDVVVKDVFHELLVHQHDVEKSLSLQHNRDNFCTVGMLEWLECKPKP
jgi:hypothetical protein